MSGRRRGSSRQTASSQPPGGPSKRQTRQSTRQAEASTEPEPKPQADGIPRRGTKRGTRRSVESIPTNDVPQSSFEYNNSPGPDKRPERQVLAPVSESIEAEGAANSDMEDADDPEARTARIKDIVEFDIPKFARWCDSMHRILASANEEATSVKGQAKLASYRKSFNQARRPFADDSALLIDSPILPGDCDLEVQAKAQTVTCSGNLISLLASTVDIRQGRKETLPFLLQLDEAFPTSFGPDFRPTSDGSEDTFDIAFRVRCRCVADSLTVESSAPPLILAAQLFCQQPAQTEKEAIQVLREGPYRQLVEIDVNEDSVRGAYQARMEELLSRLSLADRSEVIESLNEAYPKEEVFGYIRSWALRMFQNLKKPRDQGSFRAPEAPSGNHAGRADEGSESLFVGANDDAGENSDSGPETDIEDYAQLESNGPSYINGQATLEAVKQSERKLSERITPPSNQLASKGKQKAVDKDEEIEHIRLLDPAQSINRLRPARPSSSAPTRHDRQNSSSGSRPVPIASQPIAQKRSRPHNDSDNGNVDDDFEVNEQSADESRRVRYEDAPVRRPTAKRQRVSRLLSAGGPSSRPVSPPVGGARKTAGELQGKYDVFNEDPFNEETLQERDLLVLSQTARLNRRTNQASKPRQVRKPWSAAETQRLLDLIADPELSCAWSAMERQGGFDSWRNQQALRDKARGLKSQYLQADMVLPSGFDQVALGQKEKDAVVRAGRNPERKEDDVNEDGTVANHL